MLRFETYKDRKGLYRWRLVHQNGNKIADSAQGYKRMRDCRRGVELVKACADAVVETQ